MVMTATANDTVRIQSNMVLISEDEYNELLRAKENDEYRKKLERSVEQANQGKVVVKSMEELEKMAL
ncbi:MAG: toxin-antitoxin system antitoxin subunit [Lachnospiraceae bacterium]|nr:toxin-antitoxin system antitoxin subunit [Lachnospiraceae bacterium]